MKIFSSKTVSLQAGGIMRLVQERGDEDVGWSWKLGGKTEEGQHARRAQDNQWLPASMILFFLVMTTSF